VNDFYRTALATLCENEGGYKAVAERAEVNPDHLWQILKGTRLPSGEMRGVGPSTRKKIGLVFPSWLSAPASTDGYGTDLEMLIQAIPNRLKRIEAYAAAVIAIRAVATGLADLQIVAPVPSHSARKSPE
jgi:hypothetical protein